MRMNGRKDVCVGIQFLKRRMLIWTGSLLFTALAYQTFIGKFIPTVPSALAESPASSPTSAPTFSADLPAATPDLTPQPTPIDCSGDQCLNQCLHRLDSVLQLHSFTPPVPVHDEAQANQYLVVYQVQSDQLANPQLLQVPDAYRKLQQDTATQFILWSYAASLLPPDQLQWIDQYIVFTDWSGNRLSWVNPTDNGRNHWTLGIDMADSSDAWYLTQSLVHELGHVITLNADQIQQTGSSPTWEQNPALCDQLLTPYGCARPDSYINLYYQRFWKNILDDWIHSVYEPPVQSPEEADARVKAFYIGHADDFSREYAATNLYEDMADSFAMFVLNPKPTHTSVVFDKMRFYYDFPELVALRTHILRNICSYTRPSP